MYLSQSCHSRKAIDYFMIILKDNGIYIIVAKESLLFLCKIEVCLEVR